jgi:hypothetical protein
VYPLILANTGRVISEALLPLVLLPWLAAVLTESDRSLTASVAAGLLGGLAVLTRFPLIPAVAIFPPIYMLIRARGRAPAQRRLAARGAIVYVAVVCAVYAPWPLRNYRVFDQPLLTTTKAGVDLWKSNNPTATGVTVLDQGKLFMPYAETIIDLPEADQGRVARGEAMRFIRENPGRFLRLAVVRQLEFWKAFSRNLGRAGNAVAGGAYLLVAGAFLILLFRWRRRPDAAPLLWGVVAFSALAAAPFLAYPAIVRYRLPIDIAMLWTALYVLGSRSPIPRGQGDQLHARES